MTYSLREASGATTHCDPRQAAQLSGSGLVSKLDHHRLSNRVATVRHLASFRHAQRRLLRTGADLGWPIDCPVQ
jgi:hypothetical protein